MQFTDRLSERVVGQYPLSIPTSLALEAMFDIYPDRPPLGYQPILRYQEVGFNIRTLFRNLASSASNEVMASVMPPSIASALIDEMGVIVDIINENTGGKVKTVFYYSNYSGLDTHFKHGVLRLDNTDKQKEYTLIHNLTIKFLLDRHKQNPIADIRLFDLELKTDNKPRCLMVTHYAIDLLSEKEFSKLTLMESHAGHLKEKSQFYTKYYDSKELSQIPFRKDLLQVFGDKTLFRPMDIRLRRDIIELAKKYDWSSVTTTEKIRYSVDQLLNPFFKETLKAIISNH